MGFFLPLLRSKVLIITIRHPFGCFCGIKWWRKATRRNHMHNIHLTSKNLTDLESHIKRLLGGLQTNPLLGRLNFLGGGIGGYDWLTILTIKESTIYRTLLTLNITKTIIEESSFPVSMRLRDRRHHLQLPQQAVPVWQHRHGQGPPQVNR